MRLPTIPPIDTFSFWLGFASAALIVILLYWFKGPLGKARQLLAAQFRSMRESLTSGTERNLREDTLRYAQTSHLAGALFALNEILIPPRLLAPEPEINPRAEIDDEDIATVVPVLPDWPDLTALYGAKTVTVEAAFAGDGDVVVLGPPGTGKTTLLSHLASRAAQDDETLFPGGVTTIYVHAADLDLPRQAEDDAAQPLIAAAQMRASKITAARLPRHLRLRLKDFRCVVLLDGFDEMPPAQIARVAEWLAEFKKEYGGHRVIAAAGLWGYGPLVTLGLAPIRIAPWSVDAFRALIKKWAELWDKVIRSRRRKAAPEDVDLAILTGWLVNGNRGRTVFEVTLKLWAALAGDTRGNRPAAWLSAYLARNKANARGERALAKMAATMLSQAETLGLPRRAAAEICDAALAGPNGKTDLDSDDFLDDLIGRRLLVKHAKDHISFGHTLLAAYCTATALAAEPESVTPALTPPWVRALYFLSTLGDLTPQVGRLLTQAGDVMHSELLACALWLRDAPPAVKWRNEVFKRLARLMMDPKQPEALRLRALAGFVATDDPAIVALFKQGLASPDPLSRRLATLGLGAMREASVVPQLKALYGDRSLDVRWAAALALAAIGTEPAIDALAEGLLSADDLMRRGCAQALARNEETGHEILREAIGHEDIAVRRAAVYGLEDIGMDWAIKLLEDAQINEQQWIVRNAAVEALERLTEPADASPRSFPPPEAQGWLVEWAAKLGTGVPPGKAAVGILAQALEDEAEGVRVAAAEALGRLGDPSGARELYPLLRDSNAAVRDAAFRALVRLAQASGQRLAAPV